MESIKNKKDKNVLVTPPSRPPQKYLNVGLLRGKTPSEVALIIPQTRDPCVDSSRSPSSSSVVISTTPSDEEEEVVEHEEIPLVGEYDAYDDEEDGDQGDGGDGGNGGNGGDGLNGGNEVAEIEEEGYQGNDDDEEEDEEGNGVVPVMKRMMRMMVMTGGDDDEEEIQEDEEDVAQPHPQPQPKPKEKVPNKPSARHIPPMHLKLTHLPSGKAIGEPKDGGKDLFGYDSSWSRTINETIDHKNATRLFRHQSSYAKMKKWPLEGECPRVRAIVENSVRAMAAAYYLYVLASVIFPDSKGNRVSVNLLQFLDSLEELAKASRERSSQMNGNLALLQWEHVNEGHEVTNDYMPWYEGFSHGRVIRIDQTTGRRSNKASYASSTTDTRDDSSILKLVRERV
ncbi:hypothetical protein C5167_042181 [Papaver somniferum]|uniref:Uncharacterized protein n=1 Tax=Papaver somniferum TaxID=3469 RepID=A0A4Y7L601_PAPSO|nr:hypothetical protein C5167_042181 [Papaver somniferum]